MFTPYPAELRLSVGLENSPYCRPNVSQSTRTGTRTTHAIRSQCRSRTHKEPAQAQYTTSVNKRTNRCKVRAYKPRLTKGDMRCKHPFKGTGRTTGPWFCRCHCRLSWLPQSFESNHLYNTQDIKGKFPQTRAGHAHARASMLQDTNSTRTTPALPLSHDFAKHFASCHLQSTTPVESGRGWPARTHPNEQPGVLRQCHVAR